MDWRRQSKQCGSCKNNHSRVFCHTVRAMLPLLPLWDLDLGVVGRSETKVRVDDNFIHLQTKSQTKRINKGKGVRRFFKFIVLTKGHFHVLDNQSPLVYYINHVHFPAISIRYLLVLKRVVSPGWYTADLSRTAG